MAAKRTESVRASLLHVDGIEVEVRRKDIKNMYLRVLPPDGKVVVSAPKRMGDVTIELFVASKLSWIRAQQKVMQERLRTAQREGASGETLCVWGRLMLAVPTPFPRSRLKPYPMLRMNNPFPRSRLAAP